LTVADPTGEDGFDSGLFFVKLADKVLGDLGGSDTSFSPSPSRSLFLSLSRSLSLFLLSHTVLSLSLLSLSLSPFIFHFLSHFSFFFLLSLSLNLSLSQLSLFMRCPSGFCTYGETEPRWELQLADRVDQSAAGLYQAPTAAPSGCVSYHKRVSVSYRYRRGLRGGYQCRLFMHTTHTHARSLTYMHYTDVRASIALASTFLS
jgi:hypothetical protein